MNSTKTAATATCSICGRELTDPVSVSVGMGPICRVEIKNKQAADKTGNMFSNHAEFDWDVTPDGVLWMIDLDQGYKSLTNDMDHALQVVRQLGYDPAQYKIMYCDSQGIWDQIVITNPQTLAFRFASLNERDMQAAKAKLLSSEPKLNPAA